MRMTARAHRATLRAGELLPPAYPPSTAVQVDPSADPAFATWMPHARFAPPGPSYAALKVPRILLVPEAPVSWPMPDEAPARDASPAVEPSADGHADEPMLPDRSEAPVAKVARPMPEPPPLRTPFWRVPETPSGPDTEPYAEHEPPETEPEPEPAWPVATEPEPAIQPERQAEPEAEAQPAADPEAIPVAQDVASRCLKSRPSRHPAKTSGPSRRAPRRRTGPPAPSLRRMWKACRGRPLRRLATRRTSRARPRPWLGCGPPSLCWGRRRIWAPCRDPRSCAHVAGASPCVPPASPSCSSSAWPACWSCRAC